MGVGLALLFVVLFAWRRVLCLVLRVDGLVLMVMVGGRKWGSKNREKWSSGMGVLQN